MMRSMYSGVAGLKTHQTKMDVIGNNIANVNTVAYKSQSVTFSELMYQTTQAASGANAATGTAGTNARQIGLGVKTGAINTAINSQGASQTTNNPFDIRITGDAFFVVSNGSDKFFTRDGSFYVDGVGNLAMTSNGYNVMGWQVDPTTGDIKQDTVSALRIMSADNMTYSPEATSKATVAGIIDKNDTNVTSTSGKIMNLLFYDNLGYSYTAKFRINDTDADGEYTVSLDSILDTENNVVDTTGVGFGASVDVQKASNLNMSDEYVLGTGETGKGTLGVLYKSGDYTTALTSAAIGSVDFTTVNDDTKALAKAYGFEDPAEFISIKFTAVDPDDPKKTVEFGIQDYLTNKEIGATNKVKAQDLAKEETTTQTKTLSGVFSLKFDPTTGKFASVGGKEFITLGLSSANPAGRFSDIDIDFTSTTMYNNSGTSTIAASSGDINNLGTGRKLGQMSGVSIQSDGRIYASYDNGMSKLLGQIAVAEFANASGLAKEGDNLYAATQNSGEFNGIGVEVTAGGGYMTTGVLEMSNVDLSAEFTEMITTQRGFQANSRIITVSDTLLEELVNLKR